MVRFQFPSNALRPTHNVLPSIVSVVLSLGLRDAFRRHSGRSPVRVTVCRVAVSNTLWHLRLLANGCSDFPQALLPVTVLYPRRFTKNSKKLRQCP